MKNINLILFVWALTLCSCVKENVDIPDSGEKMVTIELSTADIPQVADAVSSRTVLNDNYKIDWQKDDAILIILKNNQTYKLVNVNPDGPEAVFVGEVPESWINDDIKIVFYPYDVSMRGKLWSISRGNVVCGIDRIILPAEQPLVSGTFAQSYNYSVATFSFTNYNGLYFKNAGATVGVTLTGNLTVTSIKITAPSYIVGEFGFEARGLWHDFKFDNVEISTRNPETSNTVTLVSEEGIDLTATPQNFYACVLPCNAEGEYTVTVETAQGKTFTESVTVAGALAAGEILMLGEFDIMKTFADIDGETVVLDYAGDSVSYDYIVADGVPVVTEAADWLKYKVENGSITFSAEAFLSEVEERSCTVTVKQGETVAKITFCQKSIPVMQLDTLYSDAAAHEGYVIEKSEYLPDDYSVSVSESWIKATKLDDGNMAVSVAANTTGAFRNGKITVSVAGAVVGAVNVTQTTLNYSSPLGKNDITCKDSSGTSYSLSGPWTYIDVAQNVAGSSYKVTVRYSWQEYTMIMDYVAIGAGMMSLACPQLSDIILDDWGAKSVAFTTVARKYDTASFQPNPSNFSQIEVTEEGCGYDLVPSVVDGVICFDFVPNAKARDICPEGLDGIWFSEYRLLTTDNATGKPLTWDEEINNLRNCMRPLDGQQYLRMTKQ